MPRHAPDPRELELSRSPGAGIQTSVERRKTPRAPLVIHVAYSTVDAFFSEFTRDINQGGLFIETDRPEPPETRVSLEFRLPDDGPPVRASGRVVWTSDGADGPSGMGVEFENLSPRATARINEFVRELRTDRAGAPRNAKR